MGEAYFLKSYLPEAGLILPPRAALACPPCGNAFQQTILNSITVTRLAHGVDDNSIII